MTDVNNPLDMLLVQNMALRNIPQQVIVQSAIASGKPTRWLDDLKARLALLDQAKMQAGNLSAEAKKLTEDVAVEVEKTVGKLKL